jgi:hypothetical protein
MRPTASRKNDHATAIDARRERAGTDRMIVVGEKEIRLASRTGVLRAFRRLIRPAILLAWAQVQSLPDPTISDGAAP